MIYKSIDINSVAAPTDNCGTRLYALSHGDVFVLNDVSIEQTFNMTIKQIKLGKKINDCFICTEKIKRRHWWQFWKPKYWGARFMYVEEENNDV
jgi:hypothetical protein